MQHTRRHVLQRGTGNVTVTFIAYIVCIDAHRGRGSPSRNFKCASCANFVSPFQVEKWKKKPVVKIKTYTLIGLAIANMFEPASLIFFLLDSKIKI